MLLKTYDIISDDTINYWIINCITDNHKVEKDIISKVFIPKIKSKGKIQFNNNSKTNKQRYQKFYKKKKFYKRNNKRKRYLKSSKIY